MTDASPSLCSLYTTTRGSCNNRVLGLLLGPSAGLYGIAKRSVLAVRGARRTAVLSRGRHIAEAPYCFTQLVAATAWRTPPFPCNAHLTPFCRYRCSPVKSLSFLVLFSSIYYLAPPRQVGGRDPRDALDRHPSAGPCRWRPASGPVAGAQLDIEPRDSKTAWHHTLVSTNFAVGSDTRSRFTRYFVAQHGDGDHAMGQWTRPIHGWQ
jgi:hypothetical protein